MTKHLIYLYAFLLMLPAYQKSTSDETAPVNSAQTPSPQSDNLPKSMHHAAQNNNTEELQAFWDADHPLDALDENGFTPLHIAIQALHPEAVEWLLSYGADPYGGKSTHELPLNQAVLNAAQFESCSPEQKTAFDILTLLINHGVDPMEDYNGAISPIQLAMAKDCEACIDHIMEIVRDKK